MRIIEKPRVKTVLRAAKLYKTELFFSAIFTLILELGYILSTNPIVDLTPVRSQAVRVYAFTSLIMWCLVFLGLIVIRRWSLHRPKGAKTVVLPNLSDKKLWLFTSVAIFICYLPILLTSLSMLSPDSWNTIRQMVGAAPLNNANPLIFTAFVGIFISLGRLFAGIELGTILFAFAQSALLAVIFARVIVWMRQEKVGKLGLLAAFIFYAILPINSIAGLIMWKDILFGGFGLLFLMIVRRLYIERESFFTVKRIGSFIALAFLFCTWRNNGLYAYVLFVALATIIDRKTFLARKYLLLLCAPIVLTVLYLVAITPLITPSNSQAATLIVPAQQIARTVKYESSSISSSDKNTIQAILPYDQLGKEYDPRLSDPVMGSFNDRAFQKNEGKYFGVWLKLLKGHKKTYVAAFLYNNYGYVYPFYPSSSPTDILLDNANHPNALKGYTDTAYVNGGKFMTVKYRDLLMKQVPFFQNIGFYTCIILLGVYVAIIRKRRELAGVFVILLGLFISTVLGPVNSEFRYLYLFVVAMPFITISVLSNVSHKGKENRA